MSILVVQEAIKALNRLFLDKYDVDVQSVVFPYSQIPDNENLSLDIKYYRAKNPKEFL